MNEMSEKVCAVPMQENLKSIVSENLELSEMLRGMSETIASELLSGEFRTGQDEKPNIRCMEEAMIFTRSNLKEAMNILAEIRERIG